MIEINREDEMVFLIKDGKGMTIYTPGPSFAYMVEKALRKLNPDDLMRPYIVDEDR